MRQIAFLNLSPLEEQFRKLCVSLKKQKNVTRYPLSQDIKLEILYKNSCWDHKRKLDFNNTVLLSKCVLYEYFNSIKAYHYYFSGHMEGHIGKSGDKISRSYLHPLFYKYNLHQHTSLGSSNGKESACNAGDLSTISGLGNSPREGRAWQPTPVFLHGEFQGQRNLVGYSTQGRKELDTAEQLAFSLFHFFQHTQKSCWWYQEYCQSTVVHNAIPTKMYHSCWKSYKFLYLSKNQEK